MFEINCKIKRILFSAGSRAAKLAFSHGSGEDRGGQGAPPPQFSEGAQYHSCWTYHRFLTST